MSVKEKEGGGNDEEVQKTEVVIHVEEDVLKKRVNDDVRIDEFGNCIKNPINEDFYEELVKKYQMEKRTSPLAINLIVMFDEYIERAHGYEFLELLNIDAANVEDMFKNGARSFYIEFKNIGWKKHALTTVSKLYSERYKVISYVQDVIKVTVGSLPKYISDAEVLEFLKNFGEFLDGPKDITYKCDVNNVGLGEREFTANKLYYEIPSYFWMFGNLITFKYAKQPATCKFCGQRGHKMYECEAYAKRMAEKEERRYGQRKGTTTEDGVGIEEHEEGNGNHSELDGAKASSGSYRDATTSGSMQPSKQNPRFKKSWGDGGHRPNGYKPEYQERRKPATVTMGDYMNYSKTPRKSTRLKERAVKTAVMRDNPVLQKAQEKIDKVHGLVVDNTFGENDDPEKVATEVEKNLDVMRCMLEGGEEKDVQTKEHHGNSENIRTLINQNRELLTNCYKRAGYPGKCNMNSIAFINLIEDYLDSLKCKEDIRRSKENDDAPGVLG